MELTFSELSEYLLKVSTGSEIISVDKGSEVIQLLLRQPSNMTNLRATAVYDASYIEAQKEGLMTAEQLEELIESRNIFTKADEQAINKLEDQLHGQKILLGKTTKVRANADRIKKLINKIERDIFKIKSKKYTTLMLSVENKSDTDKNNFLCSQCVYTLDEHLVWEDYKTFMQESDLLYKESVLNKFIPFYTGTNTDIIRALARSSIWRIRYVNSQKTAEPLFGVSSSEYTNDQLNLAYWSNYYQNIYEMMPEDRPSDSLIEDDEALDAYMTSYYEERRKDDSARKGKAETKGKMSAFDKEEVIVTQFNELAEEIVYDKPREAHRIKDRTDIKKKARRRR